MPFGVRSVSWAGPCWRAVAGEVVVLIDANVRLFDACEGSADQFRQNGLRLVREVDVVQNDGVLPDEILQQLLHLFLLAATLAALVCHTRLHLF